MEAQAYQFFFGFLFFFFLWQSKPIKRENLQMEKLANFSVVFL